MDQRNFTLLHVKEIPFKMNLDATNITDAEKKRLGIGFLFVIQYQKNNEASAIHVVVRLSLDESVILEGGTTFVFKSAIWNEMPHDETSVRNSGFARELIGYVLPFVNGVMTVRLQDTKLHDLILPVIDTSDLVANIKVEEVPQQGV